MFSPRVTAATAVVFYCQQGQLIRSFVNCTIEMNMTANSGNGGDRTAAFSSGLTFTDCTVLFVKIRAQCIRRAWIFILITAAPRNIVGTNFSGNNANTGGGIYLTGRSDSTVIGSCLFSGNTAVVVGGLYADLDPWLYGIYFILDFL